jgi:hypothetical protein
VLFLRAVAVTAAVLSLLPWLALPWLAIGSVRLIRILRRPLLAFATAARMLLMLLLVLLLVLLMLLAVGRLWALLCSATTGPIGRHATLTTTRGGILMRPLRLTRRATGHISSALAWALLLVHPDGEPAP